MQALRVAHAFGRHDVDRFLDEIDHEQFEEWSAYFILEPVNWQAMRLMTQRLSYMMAQVNSRKRLKPEQFDIKPACNVHSDATEKIRWEAMSIRQSIAAGKGTP